MLIRSALASDAEEIASVHVSAIRVLCSSAYDESQIAAWVSGKRPENYLEPIAQRPFFVAEVDGAVVGFSELDPQAGEVRAVYVRPDCGGRGIGGRLLLEVEAVASAARLARLYLKASLNSVQFYRTRGYVVDESTSVALGSSLRLPCVSMHKELGG